MSNITTIIDAGADAFTNLFDVLITFPTNSATKDFNTTNNQDKIAVRIADFPFPTINLETYPISYKSITLKRFKPKIIGARKLSLNIRMDDKWDIYNKFKTWKTLYSNVTTSEITFSNFLKSSTDVSAYGQIEVRAYNSNTALSDVVGSSAVTSAPVWKFEQVACVNIEEPAFTRASAEPIMLKVEFLFGTFTPPGESIPKAV